jgi:hypothetical protein
VLGMPPPPVVPTGRCALPRPVVHASAAEEAARAVLPETADPQDTRAEQGRSVRPTDVGPDAGVIELPESLVKTVAQGRQ